jgi:hypothetical protein
LPINCSCKLIVCVVSLRGGQNCRHEIGETLTYAGAGFDDQMLLLVDGASHGFGHRQLLGAMFVMGQSSGDPPLRTENLGRGKFGHP